MPHEMIVALYIIFTLFIAMIIRTILLILNKSNRGGKPMKRYGRCKW